MNRSLFPLLALATSCATVPTPPPKVVQPVEEVHFSELKQLTFGGENAEAYWRFDGQGVSLQRRGVGDDCDRIYTMPITNGVAGEMKLFSSGEGATTCAHYLADDQEVLYASTHLGGAACPPKPDMRQGYVWALYDSYDIFKKRADGSGELQRLTDAPGYDAEATVCAKDGTILHRHRHAPRHLFRDGQRAERHRVARCAARWTRARSHGAGRADARSGGRRSGHRRLARRPV